MALADQAKQNPAVNVNSGSFKRPDPAQFVPPGMSDIVDRIVAAGMKLMYSPEMRQQLMEQVQAQGDVKQKIADNTTGLMLTLDQKVKGGIPIPAIFPAGIQIAAECATVLTKAGQNVSQEDFNDALLMIYVQMGKKLGASDDQLMHGAQQAIGDDPEGGGDEAEPQPGAQQAAAAAGAPQQPPQAPQPPGGMP